MPLHKVLIANRGEIAVRIARACRDADLASVAVYAAPDRDARHVQMCDEAFALGGDSPATSYLDGAKIIQAAAASGADAVHPGYGFLSENADFAQAVLDARLTWIGPPPAAIRAVGDKVAARAIAKRVGAPLVAGTPAPVSGAAEAVDFAEAHGLPIAIKAAFGGGGRGLKVAHTLAEIPDRYESAVREAVAAFGRGECFVERYLDRPRHVETQCLADRYGTVVVVSTRDCSLQRRHQKLVEEAPAPFLTGQQRDTLYAASKAILAEAGYESAGTCEFLVGADGTLSFLEVNTRLQVEHPVSEEVTGIDLVREQLRLAAGEPIGYDDPVARGCSIEFRINCEDAGRGFLPVPGTVTGWRLPAGPGVRVDEGVEVGSVVGSAWDSLLAKLIITGATRAEALRRAARALAEFQVEGLATVLPFHRRIVTDPAFAREPFSIHTRWIETEFDNTIEPFAGETATGVKDIARQSIDVEVGGKRVTVSLPIDLIGTAAPKAATMAPVTRLRRATGKPSSANGDTLSAPMQGSIVKVAVENGQSVAEGELIAVIEAMKMEQPLTAHRSGTVRDLSVLVGTVVSAGTPLCQIGD